MNFCCVIFITCILQPVTNLCVCSVASHQKFANILFLSISLDNPNVTFSYILLRQYGYSCTCSYMYKLVAYLKLLDRNISTLELC